MWNHKLGKQGNVERLEEALSRTQSQVINNKVEADNGLTESEDASVELASMISDLYDAVAELGEIIAEME